MLMVICRSSMTMWCRERCVHPGDDSCTCRTPFSERVNRMLRELSMAICTMGSEEDNKNNKDVIRGLVEGLGQGRGTGAG